MEKLRFDVFDEWSDTVSGRRDFLKKASVIAGSSAGSYGLLTQFDHTDAEATTVPENDPRLVTDHITYPGETGEIRASMARPKGNAKLPCVIVIHENRGLNPHIEDVARRFALEGYLAIAPDGIRLEAKSSRTGRRSA